MYDRLVSLCVWIGVVLWEWGADRENLHLARRQALQRRGRQEDRRAGVAVIGDNGAHEDGAGSGSQHGVNLRVDGEVSMSEIEDAQQLGRHEAKIENLENLIQQIGADVHAMRTSIDQMKGGWKVAIWIAGVIGTIIGFVANHFWGPK